jgi:hypothetical protein
VETFSEDGDDILIAEQEQDCITGGRGLQRLPFKSVWSSLYPRFRRDIDEPAHRQSVHCGGIARTGWFTFQTVENREPIQARERGFARDNSHSQTFS